MVRNGYHQPRQVTTAAGVVEVKAPRVNDKRVDEATGECKRFSSAILPPWCRKSPKISEVLPLLYLHGLSSGDFVPALEQFLGSSAGLSPATVTRLTQQWQADHDAFMDRDLAEVDYVYVWADGMRNGTTYAQLAAGFGVGTSTGLVASRPVRRLAGAGVLLPVAGIPRVTVAARGVPARRVRRRAGTTEAPSSPGAWSPRGRRRCLRRWPSPRCSPGPDRYAATRPTAQPRTASATTAAPSTACSGPAAPAPGTAHTGRTRCDDVQRRTWGTSGGRSSQPTALPTEAAFSRRRPDRTAGGFPTRGHAGTHARTPRVPGQEPASVAGS